MTAASGADLAAFLDDTRAWIEAELERRLPAEDAHPALLHRAMRYAVFGGGKRLRPALVRMVARELGGGDERALAPGAAVELIHTYSLVHDDLPCMDDDDLRRGRPTCHVAFDEATAVLVGDGLQALAFETLAGEPRGAGLVAVLARAAGGAGMVGGQVLDLNPGPEPDAGAVRDVHERKTAALFRAAAEMGAVAAGAGVDRCRHAGAFGVALGLCFQAVDDVLDVTGDAGTLGKTPGKDAALERRTLVATLGLEGAREEASALGAVAEGAARSMGSEPGDLPFQLVEYVLSRSS